jgi:serine/threonine-protein kinase RsbW
MPEARHFSVSGRASLLTAREFAAAAGEVLRFWGLSEARACALELAVAEMACNAFRHGYRGHEGGDLHLALDWDAGGLSLVLTDHGEPFDPQAVPAPAVPDPSEPSTWPEGGLGLSLIRSAGRVTYRSGVHGNQLCLLVTEPLA